MVGPGIKVKPVERHALHPNRDFGEQRPDFGVKTVSIDAQVIRGIAQPDKAGKDHG